MKEKTVHKTPEDNSHYLSRDFVVRGYARTCTMEKTEAPGLDVPTGNTGYQQKQLSKERNRYVGRRIKLASISQ